MVGLETMPEDMWVMCDIPQDAHTHVLASLAFYVLLISCSNRLHLAKISGDLTHQEPWTWSPYIRM